MARIIHALPQHIGLLAPCLRDGDRLEVAALGASPADALSAALSASAAAWFAYDEATGEPMAMFGIVVPSLIGSDEATLWCLTCESVNRRRKVFLRESKRIVDELQKTYPTLIAFVQKEYVETVRWATRWLNFTVTHETVIRGVDCLVCRRDRSWASKH